MRGKKKSYSRPLQRSENTRCVLESIKVRKNGIFAAEFYWRDIVGQLCSFRNGGKKMALNFLSDVEYQQTQNAL